MFAHSRRIFALSLAGATTAALVVVGAGAANADVSGGTVTLTVNDSYLAQLAEAGVVLVPESAAAVTAAGGTVSVAFTATGGLGDLANFAGAVNLSGSVLALSLRGKVVTLADLNLNLNSGSIDGVTASGTDTPLFDLAGTQDATINGSDEQYQASELTIDPAGADLLDSALGTHVFTAGQVIGSFSGDWTESS